MKVLFIFSSAPTPACTLTILMGKLPKSIKFDCQVICRNLVSLCAARLISRDNCLTLQHLGVKETRRYNIWEISFGCGVDHEFNICAP